jgi:hypothetical protein
MNILPKWGFPPSEETKFLMAKVEEARTKINVQKRIFLAIPYTGVEEYSYTISEQYTLKLMDEGCNVFSPILYSHHLSKKHSLPMEYEFWAGLNDSIIEHWATDVYVLQCLNWWRSRGVRHEIEVASECGVKITFVEVDKHYA